MTREEKKEFEQAKKQMKAAGTTAWGWCVDYWKNNVGANWEKGSYISSILYALVGVVIVFFVLIFMILNSGAKK